MEFADRTGIHNLLKLITVMSTNFDLTESTSVSLPRFISNPELPLCFVWIALIIIYKYLRDRATSAYSSSSSREEVVVSPRRA
uniref:Uncharacterized protein n=1 Tax=Echinococcus canadensis TaxID=519352 RepID=A0A915EVC4_9CEST